MVVKSEVVSVGFVKKWHKLWAPSEEAQALVERVIVRKENRFAVAAADGIDILVSPHLPEDTLPHALLITGDDTLIRRIVGLGRMYPFRRHAPLDVSAGEIPVSVVMKDSQLYRAIAALA